MISASKCAPQNSETDKYTCFHYDDLVLMANMYNSYYPTNKIKVVRSKRQLWNNIFAKLKNSCKEEACWLDQPFNNAPKLASRLKPEKPRSWSQNKNEWLSNFDIDNVLNQYKNDKFMYKGSFPIDFAARTNNACVSPEICDIDLKQIKKTNKHMVGIVFNTDTHDRGGQHWISMFIGLNPSCTNFGVYYYDSVASSVPQEITDFMDKTKQQLQKMYPRLTIPCEHNKIRKQYKTTECGIYSILFLVLMQRKKFKTICKTIGSDNDVEKFRNVFYR
jgi:hypothetical protein